MRTAKGFVLVILCVSFTMQGCAAMRGGQEYGEAGSTFSNGALITDYKADVLKTVDASRAALRDFNMTITSAQKDATGGVITARMSDGTDVAISLRAKDSDVTTASIRAGTGGDEELSRAISRRIEAHL